MKDKNILLGVTGGIAAYKSAELCRLFVKAEASVQVVMSEAACEFISPLTLETLSGRPVELHMFERGRDRVAHVDLASLADALVVAPATADFLARAATGRASDLISAVTLAFKGPVLAAPAMNVNMWENPATRRNVETLVSQHGWRVVSPESGELACGWTGTGRMAEPERIFEETLALFVRDLAHRRIVVSAGPTVEDIDPVRFISNRSTGKMGYAVAEAAASRGAEVVLVSGPTALPCPRGVTVIQARSAIEMQSALSANAESSDAVIMAAAVADYRPASTSDKKLKKKPGEKTRAVELVENPDILRGLADLYPSPPPVLVGFAVETEDLLENAKEKLARKGVAIIVANSASRGFGGDDNEAVLVDDEGHVLKTGLVSKSVLANRLLDLVAARLAR